MTNNVKPGDRVLVRQHADQPRTSGTLISVNRDGKIVVRTRDGGIVSTFSRNAIVPLVQR